MRLTIFSRLILANLILLLVAANMCLYAIVELGRVSDVARSIVLVDNSLMIHDKELTDAVMAETSFDKKYLITQDPALLDGFFTAADDFDQNLAEAVELNIPGGAKEALNKAQDRQKAYFNLFREEAKLVKRGRPYDRAWFAKEKERAANAALEQLIKLRLMSQTIMSDKVKKLSDAGQRSRGLGIIVGAVTLLMGLVLSVLITRSITGPLSRMQEKTKDIAEGSFESDLAVSSPPEVGALAHAFNAMSARLKAADKMKCDFFSIMSHELRTPLTSIKEGTSLFLEGHAGDVTEKQKKLLTIISKESNRLIDLVNSILDLSKIEAGMTAFHFTPAGLPPLIERAVAEVVPLAEAKRITIATGTGELPALSLDVERMLQALRNLIGNAIKFTPPGGSVKIAARREESSVLVSVSDTGPGIPKEHQEGIFDKFRQVPTFGRTPGTGLGLAIVREIIEVHGGSVWVQSETGAGSAFIFRLPV